ncbi:MAG: S8 family serine peptidase, partial [Planctomycetota bacterium]|nr:S8 family serine peptidase [Planctomycetota bacterium]
MFTIPSLLLFSAFSFSAQDSLEGQLPKRDLGVEAFLATYPDYDGRGIRVAVLDTGVDPGHPYLQTTPQGHRKIVDWYDATSDGRLDTSTVVSSEADDLIGLSGRKMLLGKWFQANRQYHIGRIDGDFLPSSLTGRIQSDRREEWQKQKNNWAEAKTRWEATHPGDEEPQSLISEEIARRMSSFQDSGPVWDVVVFQEGESWTVVVDNDQDGNLDEEHGLHSFRETGEWATLGDEANLNYCVQVPGDGSLTMIYFDANGHGTHVAGIIGAWEGATGRMNGVAPGVEFVAIKIGDGKYGGATSGFSIAKALDYAVESG